MFETKSDVCFCSSGCVSVVGASRLLKGGFVCEARVVINVEFPVVLVVGRNITLCCAAAAKAPAGII